jgi:hypothetical protein
MCVYNCTHPMTTNATIVTTHSNAYTCTYTYMHISLKHSYSHASIYAFAIGQRHCGLEMLSLIAESQTSDQDEHINTQSGSHSCCLSCPLTFDPPIYLSICLIQPRCLRPEVKSRTRSTPFRHTKKVIQYLLWNCDGSKDFPEVKNQSLRSEWEK